MKIKIGLSSDKVISVELEILYVVKNKLNEKLKAIFAAPDFPHNVTYMVDAFDGITAIKKKLDTNLAFDLAFIEYSLHEMDGINLAKEFRSIDPSICLMLLPTAWLLDKEIMNRYNNAECFIMPPDSYRTNFEKVFQLAIEEKLLEIGSIE